MSNKDRNKEWESAILKELCKDDAANIKTEENTKKAALPNKLNLEKSIEESISEKQQLVEKAAKVYRKMLPGLLVKLKRIKDPRRPKSVAHKMTVLFLYGILMFVEQIGSRREANRSMDRIQFENLKAIFPELESMPHADTLARVLEVIEVEEIQECMIELIRDLIRRKKFRRYLSKKNYLVAVDGTQKLFRDYRWEQGCLVRHVGTDKKEQAYVYVLESVLVLDNGLTLPLLSEFLRNDSDWNGDSKQDCERKAFLRLAKRLKKAFPRLKITLLADGLYACGPIVEICKKYGWGYMITLKEGSLPDVWHEALGLMRLEPDNSLRVNWGDRKQFYAFANGIEYEFGDSGKRGRKAMLNVAYCLECWVESHDRSTRITEEKDTRYCWLSSEPLSKGNIFGRCTRMGRYRWRIENNILTEKHQGYNYEHCYSYTWNAMEGYHYLMKIGRLLNVIAVHSELLIEKVKAVGIRGFISSLKKALGCILLDRGRIQQIIAENYQLRLV